MKILTPFLSVLFGLCLLIACDKDDPTPNVVEDIVENLEGGPASLMAEINNVPFNVNNQTLLNAEVDFTGDIYTIILSGTILDGVDQSRTVLLTLFGTDIETIEVGQQFSGQNEPLESLCKGSYLQDVGSVSATTDDNGQCTATITAFDLEARLMSVTFSFSAETDEGLVYALSNGSFTDMNWEE